jgi:hypothetical protein
MKKLVLVLGIASMLVSCSNEEAQKIEAQRQIDSINRVLKHKLELSEYSSMVGARYDYDSTKIYKAYQADSLGLSAEDKEVFINKK